MSDETTRIGSIITSLVMAIVALLTWATTRRKQDDETDDRRDARESEERRADRALYSEGVWKIVADLRADQERTDQRLEAQDKRIEALNAIVDGLREENVGLRADLGQARLVIAQSTARMEDLTRENAALRTRVAELESHNGRGGA